MTATSKTPRAQYATNHGRCSCGKLRYASRKDARAVARKAHPGEHMSAYECGGYFHIGHIPGAIKNGWVDRRNYVVIPRTA
jgi:hypothetical protein